jgi:hypothetical protein
MTDASGPHEGSSTQPAGEAAAQPIADGRAPAPDPGPAPPASESAAPLPAPTGPPAYVAPAGYGAAPQAAAAGPAKAALPWFLAGVAVAVGVSIAGYVVVHSRGGGVLWWGGYIVTFGLWRTAWSRYSAARAATGTGLSGGAKAVVALGTVLALGAAAVFAVSYVGVKSAPPIADGVGSCWAESGDQVVAVSCSEADAKYVAVSEVASDADCPETSAGAIDSTTAGKVLCLNER